MPTHSTARPLPRDLRGSAATANDGLTPISGDAVHVDAIQQSHERCGALGISPIRAPDHATLIRADLSTARERNRRLSMHSVPVMEMLLEQVLATESMVVLTDVQGTVLHSVGQDEFLVKASKVALAPGVNWSEQNKGTNAIGTSLVTEAPTLVHADEHFMHANHFLTCSASPVFDPRGSMVGVLDVTGDQHLFNPHTMGLVKMSARMIQNHWLVEDAQQSLRLHFHARADYLGTLMECIVVAGTDGRMFSANRAALDHLGLSGAALRACTLGEVFGTGIAPLVDHFRHALARPLLLRLADGRQVHARAEFNWPSWERLGGFGEAGAEAAEAPPSAPSSAGSPSSSAADAPTRVAAPPGLRQLQTGDARMDAVVERIRRVLDRDIAILVQGETGSGKEVLARAIHRATKRAGGPFVAVNCASIPESLIESELFGYEEGAFTGARRKGAAGRVQQAQGGTLFLDEIGDMPLALQARLLRVLQEREVMPLGAARAVAVDVAVISATHRPLREMLAAHTFREDLYYRLNGLVVRLPPLRERSDLKALVENMLLRECRGRLPRLDDDVLQLLRRYAWPGNLRQLATVLRTAVAMAGDAATIAVEHLSEDFLQDARAALPIGDEPAAETSTPAATDTAGGVAPPSGHRTLQQFELETVKRVLQEVGGNISVAARRLGVSRNTIYRKLYWPPGAGR